MRRHMHSYICYAMLCGILISDFLKILVLSGMTKQNQIQSDQIHLKAAIFNDKSRAAVSNRIEIFVLKNAKLFVSKKRIQNQWRHANMRIIFE